MATRRLGIIMHGATSRIGTTQHLLNSLIPIRQEGGLPLANGDRLMPDPILVGRNAQKLAALAARLGVERWSADLDAALANKDVVDKLKGVGMDPATSTPDEFAKRLAADYAKWGPIVKSTGFTMD